MANVTATALRDFTHKGKQVKKGDSVSLSASQAKTYSNIDYVKLSAEGKEKVEAFDEKHTSPTLNIPVKGPASKKK